MTDFARILANGRFPQQTRFQSLSLAPTKLDAQSEWEAGQTIPLLITLACGGGAAVLSQLSNGVLASLWVCVFGVCAWIAVRRVGCTYQAAFVAALVHEGLSHDEAEAVYQKRYAD
jgi:hypothetical protein